MVNFNNNNINSYYYLKANVIGIYKDDNDYRRFLELLGEAILKEETIDIIAYNLLNDSFSLIINQKEKNSINKIMHILTIQYNNYYYEKYKTEDILSESEYLISRLSEDDLLEYSLMIHTLSDEWLDYPNSSIRAFLYDDTEKWINKGILSDKYETAVNYLGRLKSYVK